MRRRVGARVITQLLGQRLRHLRRGPQTRGAGEQLGHEQHRQRPWQRVAERLEVLGAAAAQRDGQLGGIEHLGRTRAGARARGRRPASGARRRSNTSSSARPNSSGSTRFTTMAARSTLVDSGRRPASSIVSATGISSGVVTIRAGHGRRRRGSPASTGSARGPCPPARAPGWPGGPPAGPGCARGHGVDHDEVVVVLPHLVAELADGEDLLDARRRRRHEVEAAGERRTRASSGTRSWRERYSRSESSVFMAIAWRRSAPAGGRSRAAPLS